MGNIFSLSNPDVFWVSIYAVSITVVAITVISTLFTRLKRNRRLTWELHSEYIDVSEFSNRNIPMKLTYRGTEPRWLWATYLSLRNTGPLMITSEDCPDKQNIIVGKPGCRYIGFNKLISDKSKVTLSPLFKGDDVFCKLEFDRLGPGDEILVSLLFVADVKHRVMLKGSLHGADSQIISGYQSRLRAWRYLWWLLISVIAVGLAGGLLMVYTAVEHQRVFDYQFQILVILYLLALATAAILLRPIRYWEKIPEKFHNVEHTSSRGFLKTLKFMFGLIDEL